jgi:hypothetical protein
MGIDPWNVFYSGRSVTGKWSGSKFLEFGKCPSVPGFFEKTLYA